eukprot:TRINITY_DN2994_c0_g1_i4.p1 TRINITY_DN2994_c0_g1~~TRINITY_DN2994_c0_g1_i4.p1  ORF type:complete len:443 (+),score=48.48 TRINITY_DN2994_c0_g1_i4:114-1331(+)
MKVKSQAESAVSEGSSMPSPSLSLPGKIGTLAGTAPSQREAHHNSFQQSSLGIEPDGEWRSTSKLVALFGNLTPYADSQQVPSAYKPIPNKTFMADSDREGFNNMRMCWEEAVCYAYLTRRTYRIPALLERSDKRVQLTLLKQLGRPLNMFSYYDERSFKMVIPSMLASDPLPVPDDIFQPEHSFLADPPENFSQSNLVYTERTRSLGQYAGDKHLVPHEDYVRLIQSALRIRWDLLQRAADRLEEYGLEPGKYVCLHRRRGDFDAFYWKTTVPGMLSNDKVVNHVAPAIKGQTVLVLTDLYDSDFLDKLVSVAGAARVVCWTNKTVTGFDKAFSPQLDMLSAVPAAKFFASPISTFSWGILRWRIQAGWHKVGSPLNFIGSTEPYTPFEPDGRANSPGATGTWF